MTASNRIVRTQDLEQVPARDLVHPLNPKARRHTRSLGDATGLTRLGIHHSVVAPGDEATELHSHEFCDEFIYILSGHATLYLDDASHEVGPGDFIGLPSRREAHSMKNTGDEPLVYLVGGERPAFDVCDYPRLGKRAYLAAHPDSRRLQFVDVEPDEKR
ncbi:cupin domain-containing protein [Niveibacterium sp. SC-1]|uniref:cupin domain-containing protein n=1 Tax=Niveibacterium sp. SC-1 TaxID=3135646 RepID=UPI00311DFD9E